MKFKSVLVFAVLIFCCSASVYGQQKSPRGAQKIAIAENAVSVLDAKATPAYAELLLRKTEAEVDLQILLVDYSDEAPQIVEKRFEIGLLEKAVKDLEATRVENLSKLTPAVGKLLVRKIEAEAELKTLAETYADEHPFVKKAKIRVQVFNDVLKKLM